MALSRITKKTIAVMLSITLLVFGPGMIGFSTSLNAAQPTEESASINDDGNGAIADDDNGNVVEEYQNPVYVPADTPFQGGAVTSGLATNANNAWNRLKNSTKLKVQNLKMKFARTTGVSLNSTAAPARTNYVGTAKISFLDRIRNWTRGYFGGASSVGAATTMASGAGPIGGVTYVGASTNASYATGNTALSGRAKSKGKKFVLGLGIGAAAVVAFPFLATGIGAVAGGVAAIGSGLFGMLATAATAVVGGATAALGFAAGIASSPIFIPALLVGGAIALAWYLLKKRKRQNPNLTNGDVIPSTDPVSLGGGVTPVPSVEAIPSPSVDATTPPVVTSSGPAVAPDAGDLQAAYQRYISSYNKYLGIVNYTPGSSTPQQAMQNNINSDAAKSALDEYKAAYNDYLEMRQAANQ